jgi:hypothetical protein
LATAQSLTGCRQSKRLAAQTFGQRQVFFVDALPGFFMFHLLEPGQYNRVFVSRNGPVCHGEQDIVFLHNMLAKERHITQGIFNHLLPGGSPMFRLRRAYHG